MPVTSGLQSQISSEYSTVLAPAKLFSSHKLFPVLAQISPSPGLPSALPAPVYLYQSHAHVVPQRLVCESSSLNPSHINLCHNNPVCESSTLAPSQLSVPQQSSLRELNACPVTAFCATTPQFVRAQSLPSHNSCATTPTFVNALLPALSPQLCYPQTCKRDCLDLFSPFVAPVIMATPPPPR